MTKTNSTLPNKKNPDWSETLTQAGQAIARDSFWMIREIIYGFRDGTIPADKFLYWIIPSTAVIALGLDEYLISYTRFDFLYPTRHITHLIWSFTIVYAPFWLWGLWRVRALRIFLRQLTTTLYDAGLVTALGRMPRFISDRPIDEWVREVKLQMNGSPLSAFIAAKERLSEAFCAIEDISESSHGIASIRYSWQALPENTEIRELPIMSGPGVFAVGYGRSGLVFSNLTDVPHLLIGGETNSGKSTFIRQFIAILLAFSPHLRVHFIDLKGKAEAGPFEGAKRLVAVGSVTDAVDVLANAEKWIKDRSEFLSKNGLTSIEEFYHKRIVKEWTKQVPSVKAMMREVIVIDEAAELFLAGGSDATPELTQKAKRLAIAIAAKGRAVGIHLVVATQRPDRNAVDMQIKTNLVGRVAFNMADNASSMTILDNTRATTLLKRPGRAIWKVGGHMTEVQTLFLKKDNLKGILRNYDLLDEDQSSAGTSSGEQNTLGNMTSGDVGQLASAVPEEVDQAR